MRQKSNSTPASSEMLVRNIRRVTRKHHAAEEKIRIVLDGLRGRNPDRHPDPIFLATRLVTRAAAHALVARGSCTCARLEITNPEASSGRPRAV